MGKPKIKQNFVANRNQIWDFVERATERREVRVITPSGWIKSVAKWM